MQGSRGATTGELDFASNRPFKMHSGGKALLLFLDGPQKAHDFAGHSGNKRAVIALSHKTLCHLGNSKCLVVIKTSDVIES